jgi:CARDB protein
MYPGDESADGDGRMIDPRRPRSVLIPVILAAVAAASVGTRAADLGGNAPESLYQVVLAPPDFQRTTDDTHVFAASGVLQPHAQDTASLVLPKLSRIRVLLLGGGARWSFYSPGGAAILPGRTADHPGYEYAQANDGLALFTLENPDRGRWKVVIESRAETTLAYGVEISTDGPVEEAAHLELVEPGAKPSTSIVAQPGNPVFVRTFISRNGGPVPGASWDVRARTPRDSVVTIPVFDDGKHADGKAGDGVCVGAIVAEGPDGFYQLEVEGRTRDGIQYLTTGLIEVQTRNDLLIADSIEVSPASPKAGQPVTFTVKVLNDGTDEFKNVALELYVDRVKASEQRIDLKPGVSRRVRTTWVPPQASRYAVQLTLNSYDEPYWSDFTNNTRRTTLSVR